MSTALEIAEVANVQAEGMGMGAMGFEWGDTWKWAVSPIYGAYDAWGREKKPAEGVSSPRKQSTVLATREALINCKNRGGRWDQDFGKCDLDITQEEYDQGVEIDLNIPRKLPWVVKDPKTGQSVVVPELREAWKSRPDDNCRTAGGKWDSMGQRCIMPGKNGKPLGPTGGTIGVSWTPIVIAGVALAGIIFLARR